MGIFTSKKEGRNTENSLQDKTAKEIVGASFRFYTNYFTNFYYFMKMH